MRFLTHAITVEHPAQLGLEFLLLSHLRVPVLLHRGVADFVPLGLTGLGEQDQRCGVGRRSREGEVDSIGRARARTEQTRES